MAHTEYEYQIVTERENTKFLQKVNALGSQGWRIIDSSVDANGVRAVMELTKSQNVPGKP